MKHRSSQNPPITQNPPINAHPVHNRIRSFMEHATRYAFMGEVRLAKDCGVSCAAISRLLAGKSCPSFALIVRIGQAFEKQFGKPIDLRELISLDGSYPSATVCQIVGCHGCSPQAAWNEDDTMKAEYRAADCSANSTPAFLMRKETR
jgi:transcriptional regulator with XRE-family HTH domain